MGIQEDIIKAQREQILRVAAVTGQDTQIRKALDIIEKSAHGKYKDDAENRKLGRVGQEYGSKKEKEGKEDKLYNLSKEDLQKKNDEFVKLQTRYKLTPEQEKEWKKVSKKLLERKKTHNLKKKDKKEEPKYKDIDYDSVRDWSGEDITDKDIDSVLTTLFDDGDIKESDFKIKKDYKSQDQFEELIDNKINSLYGEVREGMWPTRLNKRDIKDIMWGVIRSKNQ